MWGIHIIYVRQEIEPVADHRQLVGNMTDVFFVFLVVWVISTHCFLLAVKYNF